MSTQSFRITYDGPALRTHEMEVRQLAPALLAAGNLIEHANRVLNGGKTKVQVSVKGSFKTGSFGIDLIAAQSLAHQLVDLLTGKEAAAVATLIGFIGFSGKDAAKGLIATLKKLRGRKILQVEASDDANKVWVKTEDLDRLLVEIEVAALLRDPDVRQAMSDMIEEPLKSEGVDTFSCGTDDGEFSAIITQEESAWFSAQKTTTTVAKYVTPSILLNLESAVFKEGNKWKFNDGSSSFHAELVDMDFLAGIEDGKFRFGKGDRMLVDMEVEQTETSGKIDTIRRIIAVHDHRPGGQGQLF